MLDIMYDIPSRSGIKEVVINEEVITKREPPLIVYTKETTAARRRRASRVFVSETPDERSR